MSSTFQLVLTVPQSQRAFPAIRTLENGELDRNGRNQGPRLSSLANNLSNNGAAWGNSIWSNSSRNSAASSLGQYEHSSRQSIADHDDAHAQGLSSLVSTSESDSWAPRGLQWQLRASNRASGLSRNHSTAGQNNYTYRNEPQTPSEHTYQPPPSSYQAPAQQLDRRASLREVSESQPLYGAPMRDYGVRARAEDRPGSRDSASLLSWNASPQATRVTRHPWDIDPSLARLDTTNIAGPRGGIQSTASPRDASVWSAQRSRQSPSRPASYLDHTYDSPRLNSQAGLNDPLSAPFSQLALEARDDARDSLHHQVERLTNEPPANGARAAARWERSQVPNDFVPDFGRSYLQHEGQRSVPQAASGYNALHETWRKLANTHPHQDMRTSRVSYPYAAAPMHGHTTDSINPTSQAQQHALLQEGNGLGSRVGDSGNVLADHRRLAQIHREQEVMYASHMHPFMAAQLRAAYTHPYYYSLHAEAPLAPFLQYPQLPTALQPAVSGLNSSMQRPQAPDLEPTQGIRSALLEDFKTNNRHSRRFELKDIYDHIVEFSGDHQGSMFIQDQLKRANSEEKERVFREILPNAMQLMTDVFGNYVIQVYFDHGDQVQKKVLANKMKGHVLNLSTHVYGCRVVQRALERVLVDQQASLVKELQGHVLKCVKDQNGNHVIQKAIMEVPHSHIQFIIEAFRGQVHHLASHVYGCRVIQRLHEKCEEPARSLLLRELHACASNLISDSYGNYVVQHILEFGDPEDRNKMSDLIKRNIVIYSKQKFASNVVECCIEHGSPENRWDIMMLVSAKDVRGESHLQGLIKDAFGNYVVQKLLDWLDDDSYHLFCTYVEPEVAKARRTSQNKQIDNVARKLDRGPGHVPTPARSSLERAAQTGRGMNSMDIVSSSSTPALSNEADRSPVSSSVPSTTDGTLPSQTSSGETVKEPVELHFHIA